MSLQARIAGTSLRRPRKRKFSCKPKSRTCFSKSERRGSFADQYEPRLGMGLYHFGRGSDQDAMTLYVCDHVAHQHDQFVSSTAGKYLIAIGGNMELLEIHAVVHHANFGGRKMVLFDEAVADRLGVGQYHRRPALQEAEHPAAIRAIPGIVGKVALAGDGDRRPR